MAPTGEFKGKTLPEISAIKLYPKIGDANVIDLCRSVRDGTVTNGQRRTIIELTYACWKHGVHSYVILDRYACDQLEPLERKGGIQKGYRKMRAALMKTFADKNGATTSTGAAAVDQNAQTVDYKPGVKLKTPAAAQVEVAADPYAADFAETMKGVLTAENAVAQIQAAKKVIASYIQYPKGLHTLALQFGVWAETPEFLRPMKRDATNNEIVCWKQLLSLVGQPGMTLGAAEINQGIKTAEARLKKIEKA